MFKIDKCRRPEFQRAFRDLISRITAGNVDENEPTTSILASAVTAAADVVFTESTNMESNESREPMFFLSDLVTKSLVEFKSKRINSYLNEEKFRILEYSSSSSSSNSEEFSRFFKVNLDNYRQRGEYLIGHRVTELDWILDFFHHLAQTKNFNIMYFYARNLVNKLV